MKTFLKTLFTVVILLLTTHWANAQTQTIRGQVVDVQSKTTLIGASVVVIGSEPLKGAVTDMNGFFSIENVTVGRVSLKISYVGYTEQYVENIIVTAGKEVFLTISLEEQLLDAVVVRAGTTIEEKTEAKNEFSLVSARQFTIEETSKYAGSRNDPARMATNFAGVSGANDSRNDIIIRGNSPTGLLWRLEGIDIPSPNHFSSYGSTGGPVSMLNNNVLANSDFLTGAFSAEYGNALSGVFDLEMRNGNSFKREYMAQIGFNGVELGTEGYFKKDSRASYLANYRYSTLAVFDAMGLDLGTGSAVPYYQDLSFKIDIPTARLGRFSLFGLGGKSHIDLLGSKQEPKDENQFSSSNEDIRAESQTGILGFKHVIYLNKNTYSQFNISYSGMQDKFSVNQLLRNEDTGNVEASFLGQGADYRQNKISIREQINTKLNAKNTINVGLLTDIYQINIVDSVFTGTDFIRTQDFDGSTNLVQAYFQWQYRWSEKFTLNTGLHAQLLTLNESYALEPRLAIRYAVSPKQLFSLGYGLHSQLQPLSVYFKQNQQGLSTNKELKMTRAHHLILGYENKLNSSVRLKSEIYYQYLFDVPVEQLSSSFSLLNSGAGFGIKSRENLVNEGIGRNYGIELTLEKFYSKGYYFLTTLSLFKSEYQGSDQVWRSTTFDGNYVANGLFGKEWTIGKKGNALTFDSKITFAGGRKYTPIDVEATNQLVVIDEEDDIVFDETHAYSKQLEDYFRVDLKLGYRMNGKSITQEFFVDVQNVTNRQNPLNITYNRAAKDLVTNYQLGLFPVVQYRVTF